MELKDIPLVWVETGRPVPQYARRNFTLTKRLHPQLKQILVSDSLKRISNVEQVNTSSLIQSVYTKEFYQLKRDWSYKQKYFWLGTTSRFFFLYDFLISSNYEVALHLETDSVLLRSEIIKDLADLSSKKIAYPSQAQNIGCASFFWVGDVSALAEFLEYTLENWEKQSTDDMTLLGSFSSKFASRTLLLPTSTKSENQSGIGIFDAQSVGKFYLGTDARNCRIPFAKRGVRDPRPGSITDEFGSEELNWQLQIVDNEIQILSRFRGLSNYLNNIHIHSKQIPSTPARLLQICRRGFSRNRRVFWKIGRFDFKVFQERLHSFIARRIFLRKNFVEKIYR